MTGVELTLLLGMLGVLASMVALIVKNFGANKKANNPGNSSDSKVAHALMLASLERIEELLKEMREEKP